MKFGYKMSFCEQVDKTKMQMHHFSGFAPAQTASEAVAHLANLLNGTLPFKHLLEKGCVARLTKIDLFGGDSLIFRLHALEGSVNLAGIPWWKKSTLEVHWGWMDFDNVDREMLDALVATFPEQQRIFKGKFLEEALGL
jgi:hypothetical protein